MLQSRPHEWLVWGPPASPSIYQASNLSSGAALTLIAWDTLLTLDDEIVHIWLRPGRTHVKFIYLFARWFGLANQIVLISIFSGIQIWRSLLASYCPVSATTCEVYILFEAITFQLLQFCLDSMMFLRIYAIYRQRRRYIALASIIIFSENLASIVIDITSSSKSLVDGKCMILKSPTEAAGVGIAMMVSQSVLLYLTYRGKVLLQPAGRRSKILTVVLRDGFLVFGAVIGIVLLSSFFFFFNNVVINLFLPWLAAAPSILTARMILNLQMAAEGRESEIELTTELDIMDSNDVDVMRLTMVREDRDSS